MKQIRRSVFETNSSSVHSFTFGPDRMVYETPLYPDRDGSITFKCDYFGRGGREVTYDTETKASYCATFAKQTEDYAPQNKEMFEEVIKEVTRAKEIKYTNTDDEYDYGIDHQSCDDVQNIVFESKDSLRRFIFNRYSALILDSD